MNTRKLTIGLTVAAALCAGTAIAAEENAAARRGKTRPGADVTTNADGSRTSKTSHTIDLPGGKTATVTIERTATRDDQGGCTTRGTRTVATPDGKEGKGTFQGSLRKNGNGWEWSRSETGTTPGGEAYSAETKGAITGEDFTSKTVVQGPKRSRTNEGVGKVTTTPDGSRKVTGKMTITAGDGTVHTRDFERDLGKDGRGLHGLLEGEREDLGMRQALIDAIDGLPEREKMMMAMYYQEDLNLKEIGAVMGVSESRVCQIHTQAVMRLRGKLKAWIG